MFLFWGVLGKRTLNPEVLKCHEDLITLPLDTYVEQGKRMDNKFYIYVKTLTYLAKWGPEGGLYQSTYKMWKQSDKDFLSYCENDEVSADAAAERTSYGGYNKQIDLNTKSD